MEDASARLLDGALCGWLGRESPAPDLEPPLECRTCCVVLGLASKVAGVFLEVKIITRMNKTTAAAAG